MHSAAWPARRVPAHACNDPGSHQSARAPSPHGLAQAAPRFQHATMLAAAFQPKLAPHRPARRSRWAPQPAQQRRRPPPTRSRAPKRLPRPSNRPRPLSSPPTCSLAVRASMPVGPQGNPQVRASAVPGPEEDREVAHAAFMSAYGQSHHGPHIKGMQEFAGAVSCGCRAGPRRAGTWG